MNSLLQSAAINARSMAYFLDQPQVIGQVHQWVDKGGLYAAFGSKVLYDLATTKPEKRKDVMVRDAFVLTPTLLATKLGLKLISESPEGLTPLQKVVKDNPKLFKKPMFDIRHLLGRTDKLLEAHHHAHGPGSHCHHGPARGRYTLTELRQIVRSVVKNGGRQADKQLGLLFPPPEAHDHGGGIAHIVKRLLNGKGNILSRLPGKKELLALGNDHVVRLFGVGGMIVVAGLIGGFLHDMAINNRDKASRVNKIKEAIFQYVANIALCAVGAGAGIATSSALKIPEKIVKFPQHAMLYRAANLGLIFGGLSLGIFGGGAIANEIGRRWVNPFFEWLDKKDTGYTLKQALQEAKPRNDRKVEFLDGILHLDDLPTALAVAGVQILLPFIPLFFAVSGYRAGIGYRNIEHKGPKPEPATESIDPQVLMNLLQKSALPPAPVMTPAQPVYPAYYPQPVQAFYPYMNPMPYYRPVYFGENASTNN